MHREDSEFLEHQRQAKLKVVALLVPYIVNIEGINCIDGILVGV